MPLLRLSSFRWVPRLIRHLSNLFLGRWCVSALLPKPEWWSKPVQSYWSAGQLCSVWSMRAHDGQECSPALGSRLPRSVMVSFVGTTCSVTRPRNWWIKSSAWNIKPKNLLLAACVVSREKEMNTKNVSRHVPVVKDPKNQQPIPTAWRSVFKGVVNSLVNHDYLVSAGVPSLIPVSECTAQQIEAYIREYGESLVKLPDETWKSSVCMWMGNRWDVLIDLWTCSEGRSDLVLNAQVSR